MYSECGSATAPAGPALEGTIDAERFDLLTRTLGGRLRRRSLVGGLAAVLVPGVARAQPGDLDCGACGAEKCLPGGSCVCEYVVEDCDPDQCPGCCAETACGSRCVWTPDDNTCGRRGETCKPCRAGETCRADGACKRKRSRRSKRKHHL